MEGEPPSASPMLYLGRAGEGAYATILGHANEPVAIETIAEL